MRFVQEFNTPISWISYTPIDSEQHFKGSATNSQMSRRRLNSMDYGVPLPQKLSCSQCRLANVTFQINELTAAQTNDA